MTNTELFLEKYKELEDAAVIRYNMDTDGRAVGNLERMDEYRNIRSKLAYCREVRNLLSHKGRIEGEFAVEPSPAMIKLLDDLTERIKNPISLGDIAVKQDDILRLHPSDRVIYAMKTLKARGFSHAPIIEGGRVEGIFSISTAYSIILSGADITPNLTLGEVASIVDIDAHETEEFVFMHPKSSLWEGEVLCEKFRKNRKRIGLILLTSDGGRGGCLEGLCTPWDILSAEEHFI